uniref:N-acetylmuramoyl-L-alanine amidase n=1 Tax=Siphoviridae sp. ctoSr5 TaxID=2826460 RepID=A0A8S5MV10_9CAUD|nr:MAG TPA: peptidoglycan hydrolase [Siphoviridae sp. ctoSr5]
MSYSSLVEYVKISPNKTSPRDHAIDTITIHCMAGNLSIETCANVFAPTSRKASSNYGVGSDGRIGCYVDEADRSWCSSNKANDMRAITIEVANDGGADTGWHVSGVAMSSLIKLVADVCKRNNINKLVWSDSKDDRINHRNGCNMTVHRDFKNKDCPGAYLMSKMFYIADEVNKLLGASGGSSVSGVVPSNPAPVKSLDEVAREVINGKWGNGSERKERLEASGYVYSSVQAKVNELLGSSSKPAPAPAPKPAPAPQPAPAPRPSKSITEVAQAVMRGDYGNGEDRKNRLQAEGYNYSEVQAEVNRLCHSGSVSSTPSKSIDTIAREVIQGKWGNGSSRKSRLEAAGYNYKEVQRRVNALLK